MKGSLNKIAIEKTFEFFFTEPVFHRQRRRRRVIAVIVIVAIVIVF
jgi:hypothetical protein